MNGFPDLTESRRRSLCRLLREVEQRPEELEDFAKAAALSHPRIVTVLRGYQRLALLVRVQFPECRNELAKPYPATNEALRRELKMLDRDACFMLDAEPDELKHWLQTGDLTDTRAAKVAKKRPAKTAKQGAA